MYSQMSKGISLFPPPARTYIHCTRFPTFTCFKCKSHFLELEFFFIGHLLNEGFFLTMYS